MPQETIGRVTIKGDDAQIALVRKAFARCLVRVEELPIKPVTMEFGVTPVNPATGKPSWGQTSGRLITLNATRATRRPGQMVYVALHELAHIIDRDLLNAAKRHELMAMMVPPTTTWRAGPYAERGSEAFADGFVEAFAGINSPLDDYYPDFPDANLPDLVKIVLRQEQPNDPPPDPDPLPAPSPELVAAEAKIALLQDEITALNDSWAEVIGYANSILRAAGN